jgi:exodeoxyribonuclease VII large subunit
LSQNYLSASYSEREEVKALGAKWDATERKWYVPAGRDLAPFAPWLPVGSKLLASVNSLGLEAASISSAPAVTSRRSTDLAFSEPSSAKLPATVKKGITLSVLLAGVSESVAAAYKSGVWTMVEVLDTRLRNGHVYIEVSERSASGAVLAKSNAVIWSSHASRILPEFERATGATVGPGIKLLVRARPVFKAQFGFSIEIDAIDPDYTLGDLEARKREIRARLQQDGIFDANRQLAHPWDFNAVLVLAPQDAAGLGDFQAEAKRLEQFGLCRFTYVHSRFQGEGAAAEIRQALLDAFSEWKAKAGSGLHALPNALPDAVVIIRGGGAVNDLAWLNDYKLARCICELQVPVLTGIGHERDSTILDEVANTQFDTPSKVIAGIEQVIAKRTQEAKAHFEQIAKVASQGAALMRREVELADASVKSGALRHVALARHETSTLWSQWRLGSVSSVRDAAASAQALVVEVRHQAVQRLAHAKQLIPALLAEVKAEARQATRAARAESRVLMTTVTDKVGADARLSRQNSERVFEEIGTNSRKLVIEAASKSQALIREIAGQGPEKTLARGFAMVRDAHGAPITKAGTVPVGEAIQIQFSDGKLAATTAASKTRDPT